MDASQIAKASNPQLKQILLYLYGHQTLEEQATHSTDNLNGVGFNRIDADILSSYAQQVLDGRELSDKQYNIMKLRLPKYHGQINDERLNRIVLPEVIHVNGAKKDYSQVQVVFGGQTVTTDFAEQEKRLAKALIKSNGFLTLDPENGGLMFTPNTYPSKQIKDLGFNRWDGPNKTWHQATPKLYRQVIEDVRKMFGNIEVDPKIEDALKQTISSIDEEALKARFPSLRSFQIEAMGHVINHKRLLLALAPRLGKTVVTVIAADLVGAKRVLVVAPLSLLRDWKRKILAWSPNLTPPDVAIVYRKNLAVPAAWTVTNYDTLRLHPETFHREKWDLVICDETLLIKNRKAKRTESVTDLLIATKPKYSWFLSGAPTSKTYADLWAQLHALDPKQFSSYWKFADRYCIILENQWSKYNLVGNKPDAAQAIQRDLSHIFFTRSHEDVTDLPPLEPENLSVAMSPSQDKLYGQMEYDFLAELSEEDTLLAPNTLAQMLRLVQIASNPLLIGGRDDSPKWDALVEMLQYEAHPVIVWTSFIETVKSLELKLASKELVVRKLTGATPQDERGSIQQDFQDGKVNVLIAHPAVGKYGLDLWAARSVIYLERGYNRDDYYQSLMRVRFLEQKEAPHIIHLLSERKDGGETIDHVVDQILKAGTDATKSLTTIGPISWTGAGSNSARSRILAEGINGGNFQSFLTAKGVL